MAYLNDLSLDAALGWITGNTSRIDVCGTEPTSYAEATSTYSLGNKVGMPVGAPENRTPNGRKVAVPAVSTGGQITATGTAAYWALTDNSAILVATGSLASSQAVTSGNTFTLTSFDIGFSDAV